MARKGSGLAARLRAAVERDATERTSEERERLARLESERLAREQLFDDLAAFGAELGFATVKRKAGEVVLERGERWLRFFEHEDGMRVAIDFTGRDPKAEHHAYREAALENRWIWVRRRSRREDRLALFDDGLELLLVHALDLPSPNPSPTAVPAAGQPTPAASVSAPSRPDDGSSPPAPDTPAPVKRSL